MELSNDFPRLFFGELSAVHQAILDDIDIDHDVQLFLNAKKRRDKDLDHQDDLLQNEQTSRRSVEGRKSDDNSSSPGGDEKRG